MKEILLSLFFIIFVCNSQHYVYPVGAIDEHTVFFVYQKDCDHLQLWSLDLENKKVTQQLPAIYTSAGFQLLPGGRSFSFVDNGRIRVKSLSKRSPKSIELERPLYDISLIQWLSDDQAFLSAKYHDHFGIFMVNAEGDINFLLHDHMHDYIYPQKVNNDLFFIERTKDKKEVTYKIKKTIFSNPGLSELLLDLKNKPIAYLQMISKTQGFFIRYPAKGRYDQTCLSMTCYNLYQIDTQWKTERLFSFSLPTQLLFLNNCSRLYELLLPLLPVYNNKTFYFTSCNKEGLANLCSYDMHTKTQNFIAQSQRTHIFKPIFINDTIVFGGQTSSNESLVTNLSNFFYLDTITEEI